MDANDRIKLIREQALKAKAVSLVEERQTPVLIDTVTPSEKEEILPAPFKTNKFLSIAKGGTLTQEALLTKFQIEPEVYEAMEVTEEQGKKLNKALGRMVTGVAAAVPIICRGDACSYKESCVVGDTEVLTKEGLKAIKDVVIGAKVYSINIETMLVEADIVVDKKIIEKKVVYKIVTQAGNVLRVTSNHPILSRVNDSYKWLKIETGLQEGSEVLVIEAPYEQHLEDSVGDLFIDKIISISVDGIENVYDITVRNNSNFIANNILVHNCPFYEENVHVVGEKCPIEVSLIETWAQSFMDELNIDPNSITEIQTLSRLLEISVLERRLTTYMSIHEQDLTTEFVATVDPAGNEIRNKGPSVAFEQREKLDRSKIKLLESLNATRERKAKIKAQIEEGSKVDTSMLEIRDTVLDIARKLKQESDAKIVGHQ